LFPFSSPSCCFLCLFLCRFLCLSSERPRSRKKHRSTFLPQIRSLILFSYVRDSSPAVLCCSGMNSSTLLLSTVPGSCQSFSGFFVRIFLQLTVFRAFHLI